MKQEMVQEIIIKFKNGMKITAVVPMFCDKNTVSRFEVDGIILSPPFALPDGVTIDHIYRGEDDEDKSEAQLDS